MRFIFYWLVIFFAYPFVYGQIPQVPNQMDFAGMKLFLTEGAKRDIQKDVNALRASEKFFKLELDKANLYFPIISRVLKESGVPEDFKYLALQESDLIADAVSSANAVGFWQFKDFTAREVGLRVDKKVDERKNLVSSTEGAAKYLKRNNFQFSNWAYALSAYQAGPGGVQKYIDQKYLGKDKFTVTKKSHWYLKRFLAHKIAYQNEIGIPHSKGIVLLEYTKGQNKTLEQVAKELKVDINVLKEYNKWLLHGRIPDDKRYAVIYPGTNLPREGNTIASKKSDQEPSDPIVPTIQYPETLGPTVAESKNIAKINGIKTIVAKEDDSSSSLALAAGIGEQAFLGYNDLEEGQGIIPGQFYYIAPKKSGSKLGFHIAAWDDTLWGVSQRYGIKLRKLASKNRMSMTDEIKPGRVLWLKSKRPKNVDIEYHDLPPKSKPKIIAEKKSPKPVVSPQKSPVIKRESTEEKGHEKPIAVATKKPIEEVRKETQQRTEDKIHIVKGGETLWGISRLYKITVSDIRTWNKLKDSDSIDVGDTLIVQKSKPEVALPAEPTSSTSNYIVQKGDTLYKIARQHKMSVDELMKLNGKTDPNLSVGENLKVLTR